MEPGIHDRDRILVDHVSYVLFDVSRGDVVVLRYPLDSEAESKTPTEPFLIGQFVQLFLTATVVGNLRNVVADAISCGATTMSACKCNLERTLNGPACRSEMCFWKRWGALSRNY